MAEQAIKQGGRTGEPAAGTTEPKTAADVKQTAGSKFMAERRNVNFWTSANLRLTVLNAIVVAVIGIVSVYTSNLLTQAALASKVDNLETKISERKETTDENFRQIKEALKTDVVSPQVLGLELKPVRDQLTKQETLLNQIIVAIARNPRTDFSPNPAPP